MARLNNPIDETTGGSEERPAVPLPLTDSAGFLLNRAGRIIRTRVTAALSPLSLTPQELGILRVLAANGPLSQQALSKIHEIDRTSMVHLIDGLEARQILIRMPNLNDRRSHLIHLTPRGQKTLKQALKLALKEQVDFLSPLSDEEWDTLRRCLLKLIAYDKAAGSDHI